MTVFGCLKVDKADNLFAQFRLPDTTLYNSLVMKDEDSRRLLNAKLTTNMTRKAVLIELLYPTIFKFSCLLNLRFFPYDIQGFP